MSVNLPEYTPTQTCLTTSLMKFDKSVSKISHILTFPLISMRSWVSTIFFSNSFSSSSMLWWIEADPCIYRLYYIVYCCTLIRVFTYSRYITFFVFITYITNSEY